MKRTWTIIGVSDVTASCRWYQSLFGQPRDGAGPRPLRSDPGYGRNRPALPPRMGRARASILDEPGHGDAWQRTPVVLPRGRLRAGTEEGARARHPVRRGAAREPEHANKRVLTPGSGRVLRHDQCALCAGVRTAFAERAIGRNRLDGRGGLQASQGHPRASLSGNQTRSNRSRFMTLSHAATKSRVNFSCESEQA